MLTGRSNQGSGVEWPCKHNKLALAFVPVDASLISTNDDVLLSCIIGHKIGRASCRERV